MYTTKARARARFVLMFGCGLATLATATMSNAQDLSSATPPQAKSTTVPQATSTTSPQGISGTPLEPGVVPAPGPATDEALSATSAPAVKQDGIADILVVAQKRGVAERAQRVPIAISAFNEAAIENLHVRDLQALNTQMPNVSLSSINTIPGFANFEIRGFGINSSIPSVEPAVGVFVDGVYLGQTAGVVLDLFDIDSIEVLRGPQGTLFGRNTTGGAVSINTRKPGKEFSVRGKFGLETGLQYTAGLSVEGPITPTLRAKVAGYYTHDNGFFHNVTIGRDVGRRTVEFVRPALVWEPTSDFDTTLIYERGHGKGDGAVTVNPAVSYGFRVVANEPGFFDLDWESLTSQTNLHVGEGTITAVLGIRNLQQDAGEDLDGTPRTLYHVRHHLDQDQFSGELRYAIKAGPVNLTMGGFYFEQQFNYVEERILVTTPGLRPVSFGGRIDQHSWAGFGQAQIDLTSNFSLIAGGRYSWEKKRAQVATLLPAAPLCNFDSRVCAYNFPGPSFAEPGSNTWSKFTPKLGFQYRPTEDVQVYGSYSKGIRSGGYNVRNTALTISPGPYDQEVQSAFEIGLKSDLLDRRLRINLAAFHNTIGNLQRDVNEPDPRVGTVQVTRNAGTAKIDGVEAEVTIAPIHGLILGGNFGYLHGRYTTLLFDINGAAPGLGNDLRLARLVPWSYGVNASYSFDLASAGKLTARADYSHRDQTPFTDANTGFIRPVEELTASVTLNLPDDRMSISAYGKNLLNRVNNGAAVPLPSAFGGGFFYPISEGRVYGVEAKFKL